MKRWNLPSFFFSIRPRRNMPVDITRLFIWNRRTLIGFLHRWLQMSQEGFRQPPFQPTESEGATLLSASSIDAKGDNRRIFCCHLFCHPACHPTVAPKLSSRREIAGGSAALGDGRGDEKRAVATLLFHGQTVSSALRVPRGFALLQGRHRPSSVPLIP